MASNQSTNPPELEKPAQSRSASDNTTETSTTKSAKKASKIPAWITSHLTVRDAKVWFRCSLAAWLSLLFIVVNPTLHVFGQATFFAALVCFFLPPNGIVWVSILGGFTMLLGMCLAWAWGLVAMEAAIAARDDVLYAVNLQAIRVVARNTTNPTLSAQISIFNGDVLDTNVTVVYLVFTFIFIYLMIRLQAAIPKLTLLTIFGIIVTDVFVTTGPLIANYNYELPKVLIEPACIGLGMILLTSILVFPQSCSSLCLHQIGEFLRPCKDVLELTKETFKSGMSMDHLDGAQMEGMKKQLVALHEAAGSSFAFLPLEPSMCRWNAEDIQSIRPLMRDVLLRLLGLLNFHFMRLQLRDKYTKDMPTDESQHVGQYQTMATIAVMKNWRHDDAEQKTVTEAICQIESSSQDLVAACRDAIEVSADIVENINSRRWLGRRKQADILTDVVKHEQVLEALRSARAFFEENSTNQLLDPHAHLFDSTGHLVINAKPAPLHGLYLGLNFKYRLLLLGESLDKFLVHLIALERERTKTRFWLPMRMGKFVVWLLGHDPAPSVNTPDIGVDDKKDKEEREKEEKAQEIVDAKHKKELERVPKRKGRHLVHFFGWFTSTSGIWALRTVIVSIALAIPGVLPATAGFYYREKGLWALIMGQLALTEFMSEFVISFVGRVAGTLIGGVFGLLAWYVGDGVGKGNLYGFMAAAAPAIAILMFLRCFAPPQYLPPVIMGGATFVLVDCYSYDEFHIAAYGLPGHAYAVFWHRLVLVLCGFAAAFIVQVFPQPPSATRNAAKGIASVLAAQNEFYATLVASWINVMHPEAHTHFLSDSKQEKLMIAIYERIGALSARIAVVKYELSSSPFSTDNLLTIHTSMRQVQESLNILSTTVPHLDADMRRRLEKQTGFLETRTISDVMSIFLAGTSALSTGQALPQVLPTPLVARIGKAQDRDLEVLSLDMVKNENFSTYVVALMGVTTFYARLDNLVMHLKEAVGEKYHVEGLMSEYDV